MLHGHGNDIYQYNNKIKHDFSTNVVFSGMSSELAAHLTSCISKCKNYPEPDANTLRIAIAKRHGVCADNVIVTNGSTEAFYLLAQTFSNSKSAIAIPAFAEYEDAAATNNHTVDFCNFEDVTSRDFSGYDLLWVGNPNNPDAQTLTPSEIFLLCSHHPNMIIIIDEAYCDLCNNFKSPLHQSTLPHNLVITRSLTKTFSIPGIRLGYLVASEQICKKINRYKMPWNVNSLAIEAGLFILGNFERILPNLKNIIQESEWLQSELAKTGIECAKSNCNYFLAKMPFGNAALLKEHLINNYGILIRDASNFRGLTPAHFRVAARTRSETIILINALKEWMQKF